MKISVLGATGSVGAPAAFYIAMSGLTDELLLVGGKRQNVLEHHAIDLTTAAAKIDVDVRFGGYEDMVGSNIIINAAGAHKALDMDRRQKLHEQAAFMRDVVEKIQNYCPDAVIINAANPVDATNYAAYLAGGLNRNKLIGYSINDSYRFREALAAELGVKVKQVEGLVIGEHGSTQVPLFSTARVDGKPVTLTVEEKQRVRAAIPNALKKFESLKAGRTAGYTCAVGLTEITKAIIDDTDTILPCSIVLQGEYGLNNLSMSVPVKLGKNGVNEILELELTPDEKKGFDITSGILKSDARIIEEALAQP